MGKEHQLDPDPVSVLLAALGAVGSVVGPPLVEMAREARNAPTRVRTQALQLAGRLSDDLRHMEVDLALMEEVIQAAGGPSLPFRLGSQLQLTEGQFRRYREAGEALIDNAARSVKVMHKLERLLPAIFGPHVMEPVGLAAEAQGQLNALLGNRNVTVRDAVETLRAAVRNATELIGLVEEALHAGVGRNDRR